MRKFIYLIRHGETDYNRNGYIQGCGIDACLNEKGNLQAQMFFQRYSEVPFDKIYTSALLRAKESVAPFRERQIPVEHLEELNEISWGEYEGRQLTTYYRTYYQQLLQEWKSGNTTFAIKGGESPEDVARRQQVAMKYILAREDERHVLICMHGRALRILICQLLGLPLSQMDDYQHHNLGLYLLGYNGSEKPSLLKRNCTLHLHNE